MFLSSGRSALQRQAWRRSLAVVLFALVLAAFGAAKGLAQSNEWTWTGGSNAGDQPGVYGVLGVASISNMPGAGRPSVGGIIVPRNTGAGWTGKDGRFWLFGAGGLADSTGADPIGAPNDLWSFDPATNEWTWVWGSNTTLCAYSYECGVQSVWGTLGVAAAGNGPGSRWGASTWTDNNGDLWLFGGVGSIEGDWANGVSYVTEGELNDLWMYNPSNNQWKWMSGSSTCNYGVYQGGPCSNSGVYGTLGVPSAQSVPGGRYYAASWIDASGDLWLFGGQGHDYSFQDGQLNDLWKYTISTGLWTWMGGSSTLGACSGPICGQSGAYGTTGVAAATNQPGGRYQANTWTDAEGNLWLFGGTGIDASGNEGGLNDLWTYDPAAAEWTWVSGNSTLSPCIRNGYNAACPRVGVYGTLGVPDATNAPGGRSGAVTWTDVNGNVWLFGGDVADSSGDPYTTNEMWYFSPGTAEWTWMGGNPAPIGCVTFSQGVAIEYCGGYSGVYGNAGVEEKGNIPGSRTSAVTWKDNSGNLWMFGGDGWDATHWGFEEDDSLNDLWMYQPSTSLPPAVTPGFNVPPGSYTSGGPLTISNGMSNSTLFYTTDGSTPTTNSAKYMGPINVVESETVKAIATAAGYAESGVGSAAYIITPTVAAPVFSPPPGTYTSVQSITISDTTPGTTIYYTTDGTTPTSASTVYSAPIPTSGIETISAIGVANGYANSPVAAGVYVINLPMAALPTFSLPDGTYDSSQTTTISDGTPRAAIYYTTDGSTPSTSSTQYTAPITISTTERIEAIAVASGYLNSEVAWGTYTINPQPGFALGSSSKALALTYGGTGTVTLTVTPQNGFSTAVSFACSGLPAGANCAFNPPTVTPAGNAATTVLTIRAPAAQTAATGPWRHPLLPVPTLAIIVGLAYRWRRTGTMAWFVLLAACACLSLATGCGSGGSSLSAGGGTQTISATVTITATSGSQQQATAISLTVN
jgi:hypothetical protein